MRHRVLDPLGLYEKPPSRGGWKSWVWAGIIAIGVYYGGSHHLRKDEARQVPEQSAPKTVIMKVEKDSTDKKANHEEEVINALPVQVVEHEEPSQNKALTIEDVLDDYNMAIIDDSVSFPVKLDKTLYDIVQDFRKIDDEIERAKAIFDWEVSTVAYGDGKRRGVGYRDSLETFADKEGVCGEATYLYVALARASDLNAKIATVKKDLFGKEVKHGCAVIETGGRQIHVDPAYKLFDAKHVEILVLDDAKAESNFKDWRANNNGRCSG